MLSLVVAAALDVAGRDVVAEFLTKPPLLLMFLLVARFLLEELAVIVEVFAFERDMGPYLELTSAFAPDLPADLRLVAAGAALGCVYCIATCPIFFSVGS